jgi:hypothetical protein
MFSGFGKGIQKKTVSTPFLVVAEITLRSRLRIAQAGDSVWARLVAVRGKADVARTAISVAIDRVTDIGAGRTIVLHPDLSIFQKIGVAGPLSTPKSDLRPALTPSGI